MLSRAYKQFDQFAVLFLIEMLTQIQIIINARVILSHATECQHFYHHFIDAYIKCGKQTTKKMNDIHLIDSRQTYQSHQAKNSFM